MEKLDFKKLIQEEIRMVLKERIRSVNEAATPTRMNSDILDVVDNLQALIKALKSDPKFKGNPGVKKLFTLSGPIVKELHKLIK